MWNDSNSTNIYTTAPLFHNLVTRVFPAGNGDKTYGHVNDVYLKTAAYNGVRYLISVTSPINLWHIEGINHTKL